MARSAVVAPSGAAWQGVAAPGSFPASVSGRVLLDQAGNPWFGKGDSPWSMPGELSPSEVDTYVEDRASRSFNFAVMRAPEAEYATNAPNNYNGDAPFTGTAFQSSTNDAYWDHVEFIVSKCLAHGITVLLNPAYLGFQDSEGWSVEISAATDANMTTYGQALAARFAEYPNIIWYMGHDRNPDATEESRLNALGDALRSGTGRLMMPGGASGTTGGVGQWASLTWTANANQCYHIADDVPGTFHTVYGNTSLPTILQESKYEQEYSLGIGNVRLRYQTWGSFCAGAAAVFFGNNPIWHFGSGGLVSYSGTWQQNLGYTGSLHQHVFNEWIDTFAWSGLSPDTTGAFLTGGEDTGASRAAARYGGSSAVVYMPSQRAVTLDLTQLSGSTFTITRLDPTDGSASTLTTSASGSHQVAAQGTNSDGDSDWALVVEAT